MGDESLLVAGELLLAHAQTLGHVERELLGVGVRGSMHLELLGQVVVERARRRQLFAQTGRLFVQLGGSVHLVDLLCVLVCGTGGCRHAARLHELTLQREILALQLVNQLPMLLDCVVCRCR